MSDRQELDLTTLRKGQRAPGGGKIGVCPMCGRKGAVSRYQCGGGAVKHRLRVMRLGFQVLDYCYIPRAVAPQSRD